MEFEPDSNLQCPGSRPGERGFIDAVVESSFDGIISIDDKGIIQTINRAAEVQFGYNTQEVVGKNVNVLMPEPYHSLHDGYVRQYVNTGVTKIIGTGREVTGRRKDGSTFPMELAVTEFSIDGRRFFTGVVRDISDKKRADASAAGERRLQALLDALFVFVAHFSIDGVVLDVNQAPLAASLKDEEIVGKLIEDTYWVSHSPTTRDQVRFAFRRAAFGESVREHIKARFGPDKIFDLDVIFNPLRDAVGQVIQVVGFAVNITDRCRAEDELRIRLRQQEAVAHLGTVALSSIEMSEFLASAVNTVSEVLSIELCKILELQPNQRSLVLRASKGWDSVPINSEYTDIGNDSQAGLTLLTSESIVLEDLSTDSRFDKPSLLEQHGVVSGLTVIIKGSDAPFGVLGVHSRQRRRFSKDDLHFLQSVANVIAEANRYRQAEVDLRRAKVFSDTLLENLPAIIYLFDEQGRTVLWNRALEEVSGRDASNMATIMPLDLIPEHEHAYLGSVIRNVFEQGHDSAVGHIVSSVDGHLTPYVFSGTRIALDGQIFCLGTGLDLSETLRAEQALGQSERRYRALTTALSEVVWTTDPRGEVGRIVGGGLVGAADESWSISRWLELVHPDDKTMVRDRWIEALGSKQSFDAEFRFRQDNEAWRYGTSRALPLLDQTGNVEEWIGVLSDVSEKRRLEEQLRQSQKMDAVGQLAGGVAHDFNNLLTVILGAAEVLSSKLAANGKQFELLASIIEAGQRAASLTRQLLAFSRHTVLELKILDANTVVADARKMLRRMIGEDIHLVTVLGPDLWRVKMDPGQLVQILMNLAINARDAMTKGGTLTITTSNVELDQAFVAGQPNALPGRYVMVTVGDTGSGMTPALQSRIFEPFFTTKGVGRGTGLGLSVVDGIVRQSGGLIDVSSEPEAGTTFSLYFPAVDEPLTTCQQYDQAISSPGFGAILVVEDEQGVRGILHRVLREHGYTVWVASSGQEALCLIDDTPVQIDLLVTDVVMPGLNGPELAMALRDRQPNIRTLFLSGYAEQDILRDQILRHQASFLAKPFSTRTLLAKVHEVLKQDDQ